MSRLLGGLLLACSLCQVALSSRRRVDPLWADNVVERYMDPHGGDLVGVIGDMPGSNNVRTPLPAESRPWWLSRSDALRGHGVLRSARRRLSRPIGLAPDLLRAVLDFVPLRSYFVAAEGSEDEYSDDAVFVWEIVVSPGRVLGDACGVFLRKLPYSSDDEVLAALWFVPNSGLLAVRTDRWATPFWDVRSGHLATEFLHSRVIGASPRGDFVVGTAAAAGECRARLWRFRALGIRPDLVDGPTGASGVEGTCVQAAFSPSSDLVAVLVRQHEAGHLRVCWNVFIVNTTSEEWLCQSEVLRLELEEDIVSRIRLEFDFRVFAFDGERVLLRLNSGTPSLLLRLRDTAGHYELVGGPLTQACDDVLLSRGLVLRVNDSAAVVGKLADEVGAKNMHEADMPMWHRAEPTASFSPDGRKALVIPCQADLMHYVWDFAGEQLPQLQHLFMPRFSPDSASVVGKHGFLGGVVVLAVDGSTSLYLGQQVRVSRVAVSDLLSW